MMKHKIIIHNQNYRGYVSGYGSDAVISPATYVAIPNIWERFVKGVTRETTDGYAVLMPETRYDQYVMDGNRYWKLIKFFETKEEAVKMRDEINL